jgi:O-antigen/teichoic acid export membrane protein
MPDRKIGPTHPYERSALRIATFQSIGGRIVGSILGVAATVIVARELTVPAYAAYVALIGLLDLLGAASSLAIEHVALRYVPELSVRGQGAALLRVARTLFFFRFGLLAGVVLLAALLASPILSTLKLDTLQLRELMMWLPAIFLVIATRFSCACLEIVVAQRLSASIMAGVAAIRVALLSLFVFFSGPLQLVHVINIEILIQAIALIVAGLGVSRVLRSITAGSISATPVRVPPDLWNRIIKYWKSSAPREAIYLFSGKSLNRLIATRYAGGVESATYGFAQTMTEFIQRYLPSTLTGNLASAAMTARHTEHRNFGSVDFIGNLTLKLDIFLLVPLCTWMAMSGPFLTNFLTKGKYPDSAAYLVGLMIVVALESHAFLTRSYANVAERVDLTLKGSFLLAFWIVPAILLVTPLGIWGLIIARGGMLVIHETWLAIALVREKVPYHLDKSGLVKILVSGVTGFLFLHQIVTPATTTAAFLGIGCMTAIIYLIMCSFTKPFSRREREALNRLLGTRIPAR